MTRTTSLGNPAPASRADVPTPLGGVVVLKNAAVATLFEYAASRRQRQGKRQNDHNLYRL
jgi:hypothetical protein